MGGKIDRMGGEIKSLREKCDRIDDIENRQKYHEVLLKNQKWNYSADHETDPDVADNSREKQLLDDIKEMTCNMRYGKFDGADGKCNGKFDFEYTDNTPLMYGEYDYFYNH